MTMPVVMTRQCRETELEQKGVTGAALECLLAETTQERHRSRVAYARWSAEEYYLAALKLDRDEAGDITHAVGAILWADVIGIGGRDGVEGAATARHPAFANCGKGRKQASDGGAWSAAILEAARECRGCFRINELGYLTYRLDGSDSEIGVDDTLAPAPWVYSILREGLRRAAGLRSSRVAWADDMRGAMGLGWHPAVPFDAAPESLAGWAKIINEATPVEPQMPTMASVSVGECGKVD